MVVNPTGRTPGTSTVSVLNVRRTCSISPVEESPEFSWNKSLRSQCCFPLQGRVKRSRTCGPRCCLSSWRRCSVCCSRFVPPPHSCRFSTSPSSCRWSTAPSSTAATRLSSAWREYQPHAHAHAHAHAHTSLWTKLLSLFIFTWLNCHLSVSVCAVSRHATLGSCTVWSWLCRQCSLCCSIPASPWWKLWMETLYMWVRSDGTTLNPITALTLLLPLPLLLFLLVPSSLNSPRSLLVWLQVNVGLTLLSLLAFIHPLAVYLHCRRLASQRNESSRWEQRLALNMSLTPPATLLPLCFFHLECNIERL